MCCGAAKSAAMAEPHLAYCLARGVVSMCALPLDSRTSHFFAFEDSSPQPGSMLPWSASILYSSARFHRRFALLLAVGSVVRGE